MFNIPTQERLAKIPALYETENIPATDKPVHLHFFLGGCDWYVCEFDGQDLFWGFAILNGDFQNSEFGYFSFGELQYTRISGIEVDCELKQFWKVRPTREVDKICEAQGWNKPEPSTKPFDFATV